MNDAPSQSTLREWRTAFVTPQTLGALAATSAVLTLAGPFDTNDMLSLAERAVYWSVIVCGGYGLGLLANILTVRCGLSRWRHVVLSGALCAVAVLALVLAMNFVTFGYVPQGMDWVTEAGTILAISAVVNSAIVLLLHGVKPEDAPAATTSPVPLLDRLPPDKRAPLVSISVEDHYVRVRTRAGEELLLMRLSDAIRETGQVSGGQVHRSHWAAFDAVTGASRSGDRAILTMSHGPEIPVSRSNLDMVRKAGLLSR